MGRGGLVVIYDDKMLGLNKTANMRLRHLYETGSGVILTIGDGDFSFSAALASQFHLRAPNGTQRLLATSYDSQSQVTTKYTSTAGVCLDTLKKMNIPVLHNIDATKLYQTLEVNRYRASKRPDVLPIPQYVHNCSRIIFNFPNLGNLGAKVTEIHQELLKNFFIQCLPLLVRPNAKNGQERGEVHLALRNSPFYEKWDIVGVGESVGYKLLDKGVFKTEHYPGYEEQRTNPGIMRAAPPKADGATIYRFVIDDKYVYELEKNGMFDVQPIDTSNLNAYTKSIMPSEIVDEEPTHQLDLGLSFQSLPSLGTSTTTALSLKSIFSKDAKTVEELTATTAAAPTTTSVAQTTDVGKFEIQPNQIVSFSIDPAILKRGVIPTHTSIPSSSMAYQPVFPLCPSPPNPKSQAKVTQPVGLFTFYHTLLSTADLKSRNFRVGVQELRSTLEKADPQHTELLKAQLKQYTNEALVNGALIIQPIRATEYERVYRADILAANQDPSPNTSGGKGHVHNCLTNGDTSHHVLISGGKKQIVTKTTIVKRRIGSNRAVTITNETSTPTPAKPKFDLPHQQRLYHAQIIGILSPQLAKASSEHLSALSAKLRTNKKGEQDQDKKSKTRKPTSQSIDSFGNDDDELSSQHQSKRNRENKAFESQLIADEDLGEFLGDANLLGHKLAFTAQPSYKMGYKEKEQLRKQKLRQDHNDRSAKRQLWQATRRVQHCEEKGKEARRGDRILVDEQRHQKELMKQAKHQRKQDRRIARTQEEASDSK